jgi:uncharacterized membrane protein
MFPLLFAYLTRFLVQDGPASRRDLAVFGVALWLAISVRSVAYDSIFLLYFAIPWRKVEPTLPRYALTTAALAGFFALTIGGLELVWVSRSTLVDPAGETVEPLAQLRFTIEHPLEFLQASYNTLVLDGEVMMRQAIGVFGWVGFETNFLVFYAVVAATILLCYHLTQSDVLVMPAIALGVLWLTIAVTAASLFLALYTVWSPVGGDTVEGLQGRYFVGLAPFTLLALSQTAAAIGKAAFARLAGIAFAAFLVLSIFKSTLERYY